MTVQETMFHNWNQYQLNEEDARLKNVQKLIDFYNGDHKRYLKQYLKLKDLDDFPFYETGITKKIVRKKSEVYKSAPIRYFDEKRNEKYDDLTRRKNIRMKTVERQANLLGVVGVRPIVTDEGVFDYVLLRSMTVYTEGTKAKAVKYLIQDNGDQRYYEYWTDEKHLILDENNAPVDITKFGYDNEENEYGVIPFVWCRNEFMIDDFYNTSGCADDIVNANEQIDLMLSEMCHKYRYAAFNPIWGKGNVQEQDLSYGYNKIAWIDDPDGMLGTLNLSHNFADDIEAIKFQMQLIERNHGLNINWGISGNTSGFSLVIQNIDHQDNIENMQDVCLDWEHDILKMERIVAKKHGLSIPEKDFRVDYQELRQPLSIEEQNKKWEFEFKHGLSSRADYWRAENPDISDEQIEERLKKIGEENKTAKQASQTEPTIGELFGNTSANISE